MAALLAEALASEEVRKDVVDARIMRLSFFNVHASRTQSADAFT